MTRQQGGEATPTSPRDVAALLALACGAVALHGYHGGIEDTEIYLPGVLKLLQPALFQQNAVFFASHAGMSLYPRLVAASIRWSHLPVAQAMLLWHVITIFIFLWGCLRVARVCFAEKHAAWCGVALAAALLTIPVAGTALYIMDQYMTARSFSTAASLMAVACMVERRYLACAVCVLFTMTVHPLMSLFLVVLVVLWLLSGWGQRGAPVLLAIFPMTMFPPVTAAYRVVVQTHPYFLLTNWAWYEWLGIFGPLLLLLAGATWGRRLCNPPMLRLLRVLVAFESLFFVLALFMNMPGPFERFAEVQPLRCLLLVYTLMFLLGGGLLGQWVLRRRAWRWALLFVPLCAGMAWGQAAVFSDSAHLELPWLASHNPWVRGFEWIRDHTPMDAYFALDPEYEQLPGEDVHGFRANAWRSMMADYWNDSGAPSMFPALSAEWNAQVEARRGWKQFQLADFRRLKARHGVDWVVLQRPGVAGLVCPYQNERILICRID